MQRRLVVAFTLKAGGPDYVVRARAATERPPRARSIALAAWRRSVARKEAFLHPCCSAVPARRTRCRIRQPRRLDAEYLHHAPGNPAAPGLHRAVALVVNSCTIRRPLGLPADGLHERLPKW
jgi:hypothetical protein